LIDGLMITEASFQTILNIVIEKEAFSSTHKQSQW